MKNSGVRKPDFMIIGAQKAGTTYLWHMINEHPETDLPDKKEIHFFGSAEIYRKGYQWYYSHFDGLDPTKITGEASTTYLYDRLPYWYNKSNKLEHDNSLPCIPELITKNFPEIKVIAILRDPVTRAISAYKHWIKNGTISPFSRLKDVALKFPKTRILEYGYYSRYLNLWKNYVPENRMRIYVYEEDIKENVIDTLKDIFDFLKIEKDFLPSKLHNKIHKTSGWLNLIIKYYTGKSINRKFMNKVFAKFDGYFEKRLIRKEDIQFLREHYSEEKGRVSVLINRNLNNVWSF